MLAMPLKEESKLKTHISNAHIGAQTQQQDSMAFVVGPSPQFLLVLAYSQDTPVYGFFTLLTDQH